MNKHIYEVRIILEIEANNEEEAKKLFFDRVDDQDYPIEPEVEKVE